jgi:hypothetical protein
MPKKANSQNDKTNINFLWLYDFQRSIATEEIIKEKKLKYKILSEAVCISQSLQQSHCMSNKHKTLC